MQVVRVGEKNNFNFTQKEIDALESFKKEGRAFFVNSNSKVTIKPAFPSIVTINPDMVFEEPKGDLSNVSAFRVKLFITWDMDLGLEQIKALDWIYNNSGNVLVTFMRFKSKKTLCKYTGVSLSGNAKIDRERIEHCGYVYDSGYYRPTKRAQENMIKAAILSCGENNTFVCDENGTGCPDCNNCLTLNGFSKDDEIVSLNLSVSGIKDKNGKQGLCPFSCPDCWAKIVTFGKSPACDKIIKNRKQKGEIKHI